MYKLLDIELYMIYDYIMFSFNIKRLHLCNVQQGSKDGFSDLRNDLV